MKGLLFLLSLLVLSLSLTKIQDSGTNIKVVDPEGSPTRLGVLMNEQYPDVIPGAQWIWENNGYGTASRGVAVFEYLTYLNCKGELILSVAAYGVWRVYWDGTFIRSGLAWQNAVNVTITPTCGKHNLTIARNR